MEEKRNNITVSLRIKPNKQDAESSSLEIISKNPPVIFISDRAQTFHFDNILPENTNQEEVYNKAVKPFVDFVQNGYNCTVFAYGQTGSGKTFTMGSLFQTASSDNDDNTGIIPRALEQLFNLKNAQNNSTTDTDNQEVNIKVSYSEIYNEKVFDLLQCEKKSPLQVSGFVVKGLSIKNVENLNEAKELLEIGNKNRHIGETKQNLNSSRSHAIFTIYFTIKTTIEESTGKLNLVDLAGSESVKKTGNKGNTFQEGININKGLLCIGQVISALSAKSNYIPYRQSIITSLLKGSLNVDNYISLIACVSPKYEDIAETMQTLDFAFRAKKIHCNPEVNQIVAKFKMDNPNLMMRTPLNHNHRFSETPLRVSTIKKRYNNNINNNNLPLINESVQQISADDHLSVASSVNAELTQQALSPIIRKYMNKIEQSLMGHIETVIKTNLRRSVRLQASGNIDDKENTPNNSQWNQKMEMKVTQLVRNEFAQFTGRKIAATSSPINEEDKIASRRILDYDEPKEFSFKVPAILPQIKNTHNKIVRRSVRLSMMKNRNLENSTDFVDSMMIMTTTTTTKSNNNINNDRNNSFKIMKTMKKSSRKNNSPNNNNIISHSKKVLLILNKGSKKEVESLQSVGPKTAERILLYRELKGKFKKMEDLIEIPGWGRKKYENFMMLNFLKE